jgi:hypothetical protein
MMWITLWASCVQRRQVVDSAGRGLDCPLPMQLTQINEINDLADQGQIPMAAIRDPGPKHEMWG